MLGIPHQHPLFQLVKYRSGIVRTVFHHRIVEQQPGQFRGLLHLLHQVEDTHGKQVEVLWVDEVAGSRQRRQQVHEIIRPVHH
ncbi:hypothetical protein D9M71_357520 [compost metagenome]